MVFLLVLVLGVIEIALALYGRNVLLSSAHEGARSAVELGRTPADAEHIAADTVRRSAGGLVENLAVGVAVREVGGRARASVRVSGVLKAFGPVPARIPVSAVAHASRDATVP
jgi:Flp pilus assembly protein TadG